MTILDQTGSKPEENGAPERARVTRPTLERDAPIRNWTTLFGPAWGAAAPAAAASSPALGGPVLGGPVLGGAAMGGMANAANAMFGAASQTLTDAVGQGYRVINEYLAQGQRQAEALRFPDWSGFFPGGGFPGGGFPGGGFPGGGFSGGGFSGGSGSPPGPGGALPNGLSPELQQQLFRRFLQYGMDFAGLWFEMWSRMGWPAPPGGSAGATPAAWAEALSRAYSPSTWAAAVAPGNAAGASPGTGSSPGSAPAAPPLWPFAMPFPWAPPGSPGAAPVSQGAGSSEAAVPGASNPAASEGPERVFVAVSSQRRVESMLELRRGPWSALTAHALRPEGHDAPAIRGVSIEARPEESLLRVSVEVPADQAPGVYNGMIVDTVSNLPRGTLTVRVLAAGGGE